MKAKYFFLIAAGIIAVTLIPMYFSYKDAGMFDMVTEVLGKGFWYGVLGFVVLIIAGIYFSQRWLFSSIKPKDIPNGLPATATVIRSYQSGMAMRYAKVHFYYELIIEVNVRNQQGETWQAKIEQVVPMAQLGMFVPGLSFAVKYDPKNKSKVVIDRSREQQGMDYGNIPGL